MASVSKDGTWKFWDTDGMFLLLLSYFNIILFNFNA